MKKILIAFMISIMLCVSPLKDAKAGLVFDLSEIASEVSEVVGKITDISGKITQKVNMVKEKLTRGFSKDLLSNLAGKFLKTKLGSKVSNKVGGTDAKNANYVAQDLENYETAFEQDKGKKLEKATEIEQNLKAEKTERKSELSSKESQLKTYRSRCDQTGDKETCAKADELDSEVRDLKTSISDIEIKQEEIAAEKEEIKNTNIEDDAKYKTLTQRKEDIEERAANENADWDHPNDDGSSSDDNLEWDDEELATKFGEKLNEEAYKAFITTYFYDPENHKTLIEHQGRQDEVVRQRKHLVINTATHLLQVSATVRRKIPNQRETMNEYMKTAIQGEGELEAISAYTATRIENIKAMILYAKILTAKLQYQSAKQLLNSDIDKSYNINLDNDMDKYLMTEEYLKSIERTNTKE